MSLRCAPQGDVGIPCAKRGDCFAEFNLSKAEWARYDMSGEETFLILSLRGTPQGDVAISA